MNDYLFILYLHVHKRIHYRVLIYILHSRGENRAFTLAAISNSKKHLPQYLNVLNMQIYLGYILEFLRSYRVSPIN